MLQGVAKTKLSITYCGNCRLDDLLHDKRSRGVLLTFEPLLRGVGPFRHNPNLVLQQPHAPVGGSLPLWLTPLWEVSQEPTSELGLARGPRSTPCPCSKSYYSQSLIQCWAKKIRFVLWKWHAPPATTQGGKVPGHSEGMALVIVCHPFPTKPPFVKLRVCSMGNAWNCKTAQKNMQRMPKEAFF